jgi:hypothetical protein
MGDGEPDPQAVGMKHPASRRHEIVLRRHTT